MTSLFNVRSPVRFNVRSNVISHEISDVQCFFNWGANDTNNNVMVIRLCLIWLNKHVKKNKNSILTYLLRYSLLITSI